MKYGSLFSGIGGLDLGFDRAGMICEWQVEIDPQAQSVLSRHWPDVRRYDDIRQCKKQLTPVDVIVGGFPCQDVSVAGGRAGLAGERSGLWYEFEAVITRLKPEWVIIENVPGLLSSNGGRDFATILNALVKRGYGVAWRVLNSQYFGVPQRRRRVYIVGHLGDGRAAQVLFESIGGKGDTSTGGETQKAVADGTGDSVAGAVTAKWLKGGGPAGDERYNLIVANPLTAHMAKDITDENHTYVFSYHKSYKSGMGISQKLSPTITTHKPPAIVWQNRWQSGEVRIYDGKSPTLLSHMGTGGQNVQMVGVRKLTPVECERLQGFPDGWTEGQGQYDNTRYRQLGNAVTVNVAEWIGRRILAIDNVHRILYK